MHVIRYNYIKRNEANNMTLNEYDLIKEAENKMKGIAGVMTIIESSQIETIPSEVWSILSDSCYNAIEQLHEVSCNQNFE